jgi:hypothetical protein
VRLRPRNAVAACALLLAASWTLAHREPPEVPLRELAPHEGGAVAVQGLATRVRTEEGRTRYELRADGVALRATAPALALAEGAWVRAEGRLVRSGGSLLLVSDEAAQVQAGQAPALPAAWAQVAARPWEHLDRPLELAGTLASGRLRGDDGQAVALAGQDLPRSGAARVRGHLAYDDGCLCFRLHAAEVLPWTA